MQFTLTQSLALAAALASTVTSTPVAHRGKSFWSAQDSDSSKGSWGSKGSGSGRGFWGSNDSGVSKDSASSKDSDSPRPSASSSAASPAFTHEAGGEEHIIILNSNCPHPDKILNKIDLNCDHDDVSYTYNNSAFQGFAARLHDQSIQALGAMDDVSHVEKAVSIAARQVVPGGNGAPAIPTVPVPLPQISSVAGAPAPSSPATKQSSQTRPQSPWGLQRVSSSKMTTGDPSQVDFTYSFDPNSALGKNVDVYVVDTGINTANAAFNGRAKTGFSFMKDDPSDGEGHGTHTAGTAAGFPFGLASNANIIGVKVLGSNGAGKSSDTIAGIDYAIQQHDARKAAGKDFAGSVMSMSWGLTESSTAINNAINGASQAGMHVAVAAGNSGSDACAISPAQLGGPKNPQSPVISVGSVGQSNQVSDFSNNGACVDVYAPGEEIISSWIGGPNMVNSLSGTSMSTPHVSGLMAVLAGQDPSVAQNPAAMKKKVMSMALKGQVSGNVGAGGQGLLLNNGITS